MVQNREEAETIVKAIERHCRGPYVLDKETRVQLWNEYQKAVEILDAEAANKVRLGLEVVLKMNGPKVIQFENLGEVGQSILVLLDTRKGCGTDFNQHIIANKFDGKTHTVTCPGCGEEHEYQAPWFEGLTEHEE